MHISHNTSRDRLNFTGHVRATAHLLLPGISDIGTFRDVSARIGQDQFTTTSRTYQRDNQGSSMSQQSTVLEVAPPEWIREAIPAGQALALISGHKPLRVKIPGWWEDPQLRYLVDTEVAAGFDALHAPAKAVDETRRPGISDLRTPSRPRSPGRTHRSTRTHANPTAQHKP